MAFTVLLGLGESGIACARWLTHIGAPFMGVDDRAMPIPDALEKGITKERDKELDKGFDKGLARHHEWNELLHFGVDFSKPEEFLTTRHEETKDSEESKDTELIISPGLSPARLDAVLRYAQAHQMTVGGELTLFARGLARLAKSHQYQPKIIAITGTNGKTTCTQLTAALLESAGLRAQVAGNVSPALLEALLTTTQQAFTKWPEVWVLELSSFQLHYPHDLAIDAAAILNVTQDHLDWHADMEEYAQAKLQILNTSERTVLPIRALQGDLAPYLDRYLASDLALDGRAKIKPAQIDWISDIAPTSANEWGFIQQHTGTELRHGKTPLIDSTELQLKGRHNYLNALSALALCHAIGVEARQCLAGLRAYAGEAHRCQSIATIAGIEYIDDSKATNVGAVLAAVQSGAVIVAPRRAQQWLILGGEGKGQDFTPLRQMSQWQVGGIALIGQAMTSLHTALAGHVPIVLAKTLDVALAALQRQARSGDRIMLSPACASFDQFRDYKHRGECFAAAVHAFANQALPSEKITSMDPLSMNPSTLHIDLRQRTQ